MNAVLAVCKGVLPKVDPNLSRGGDLRCNLIEKNCVGSGEDRWAWEVGFGDVEDGK